MRTILVCALTLLLCAGIIFLGCKEEGDTVNVTNTSPVTPYAIEIGTVPGYLMIPELDNPLKCYAYFSSYAAQDWTDRMTWRVLDSTWATITPRGILRPKRVGTGYVEAVSQDGWTAEASFTVSSLSQLALTVNSNILLRGEESPVSITAVLSDGMLRTVSSAMPTTWILTRPAVAHRTSSGSLLGDITGQTVLTVSLGNIHSNPVALTVDSILSLTCLENSTGPYLPMDTIRYRAVATTYLLGTMAVSDRVDWVTSNPDQILCYGNGVLVPTAAGTFDVHVRRGTVESGSRSCEVWDVTALSISPAVIQDTLARGDTIRFTATATVTGHGDQTFTNRAQWISSNPAVGSFVRAGVFVASANGQTEISAQSAFTVSPTTTINVFSPALISDGFETYPLGTFASNATWQVYTGSSYYNRVKIDTVAVLGTHGCALVDSDYSYSTGINTQPAALGMLLSGTVEFDLRPQYGTNVWIGGPSSSYSAVQIYFYSSYLTVNYGSDISYTLGNWYHFKVEFDCQTDRFNLSINNTTVLTNSSFYYPQAYLDYVGIYASSSSYYNTPHIDNVWIDGVVQSSATLPCKPVLQGLNEFSQADCSLHRR
jgi:hypothetical protein